MATTIVKDHTQVNTALMQVAKREGVTLPKDTDPAHKAAFDKAHITNQVKTMMTRLA